MHYREYAEVHLFLFDMLYNLTDMYIMIAYGNKPLVII